MPKKMAFGTAKLSNQTSADSKPKLTPYSMCIQQGFAFVAAANGRFEGAAEDRSSELDVSFGPPIGALRHL